MTEVVKKPRLEVVDALRGFAVLCIILLHNMEHFEFYYIPKQFPEWLINLDAQVLKAAYFLFGGKAYAIFAVLFGFSFYIQHENQKQKGIDFRIRFFWRMVLLLFFGFINTAFYQGDILTLYAILGLTLIPICNLSTKIIFIIALVLLVQPLEWIRYFYILLHPDYVSSPNLSLAYYKEIAQYMTNGSFIDYVVGNVTLGKTASLLWSWEYGRFFQAPALFMLGFLAGRKQIFDNTVTNLFFWKTTLIIASIVFLPLYIFTTFLPDFYVNKAALERLVIIFGSLSNFTFMLLLMATFVVLFQTGRAKRWLSKLIPCGKMSLTTYIMQSIIGAILYYQYGLAWYQNTGTTMCLFIGIISFILQLVFCTIWLRNFKQGPLEYIWYKLTWINFNNNNSN